MAKNKKINIQGKEITIIAQKETDYISLTDMARSQLQEVVIIKWLSLKSTIEYLGEWEALYNTDFNYTEFGTIKNSAGSNNFVLSVKQWIAATKLLDLRQRQEDMEELMPIRILLFILECGLAQNSNYFWLKNTSVLKKMKTTD